MAENNNPLAGLDLDVAAGQDNFIAAMDGADDRIFWKLNGFHQSGRWHIDNHLQFRSGYEIHTGVNLTKEGLTEDFDIYPSENITVPASTYDHVEGQLYFTTPPTNKISFSVMNYIGGFFGGDRIKSTPSLKVRFGDSFNSEFSYNYNSVNLPQGDFVTYLSRARQIGRAHV